MASKRTGADAEFFKVEIIKTGKNKGKERWKTILKCTEAERLAILVHCGLYPPETPLDEVRKRMLNIAGIHEHFQKLIDAGATKVGDIIGYGN